MPVCKTIRRPLRKLCSGDLINIITLYNRDIGADIDSVDFEENLSGAIQVPASISTKRGVTVFDGTNTERVVTHWFGIRYISDLTQEKWLQYDGRFFDIFDVEDLDERHQWMILMCAEAGDDQLIVNRA